MQFYHAVRLFTYLFRGTFPFPPNRFAKPQLLLFLHKVDRVDTTSEILNAPENPHYDGHLGNEEFCFHKEGK
jgi:hypothetical protein